MSADLSDPAIVSKYQEITAFTSPVNWCAMNNKIQMFIIDSSPPRRLMLSYRQVGFVLGSLRRALFANNCQSHSQEINCLCTLAALEASKSCKVNFTEMFTLHF